MTAHSLIDALRADFHARFAVVRGLADLEATFDAMSAGLVALRRSVEVMEIGDTNASQRILSDLLAVDALAEEVATRIRDHQLALATGVFAPGAGRPA